MAVTTKRLTTVKQTAELYPAFPSSSLRWLIFNKQTNGFAKCIRKIGRKVLIDLDQFESWVDSHKDGSCAITPRTSKSIW